MTCPAQRPDPLRLAHASLLGLERGQCLERGEAIRFRLRQEAGGFTGRERAEELNAGTHRIRDWPGEAGWYASQPGLERPDAQGGRLHVLRAARVAIGARLEHPARQEPADRRVDRAGARAPRGRGGGPEAVAHGIGGHRAIPPDDAEDEVVQLGQRRRAPAWTWAGASGSFSASRTIGGWHHALILPQA